MRFHPLFGAIVGALAIAAAPFLIENASYSGPEPYKAEQAQQSAGAAQRGTALDHAPDNQPGTTLRESNKPEQPKANQDGGSSAAITNWIQAISALAVAVFTGFLWSLQSQQVGLMAGSLTKTGEATDQMREANRLTQEALHLERPWIKIIGLTVKELAFKNNPERPDIGDHFHVSLSVPVQNVGRVPAMEVQLIPAIWLNPIEEANFYEWERHWLAAQEHSHQRYEVGTRYGQLLFPQDTHTFQSSIQTSTYFPPESLIADRNHPGRFRIFVGAFVFYRFADRIAYTRTISVLYGGQFEEWVENPVRTNPQQEWHRLPGADTAA